MTRFSTTLRNHLILLVLVALVPMLLWSAGLTLWNASQERRVVERGLEATAEALTLAIDQGIRLASESLQALAISRTLRANDYAAFQGQAQRLVDLHPDWLHVRLVHPSGRVVMDTMQRFGTSQVHLDKFDPVVVGAIRQVFSTGRPVVSDLYRYWLDGRHMVAVAVPVFDDKKQVTHVLTAGIPAERLAEMLQRSGVPSDWVAALLDRDLVIVARTRNHDATVGHRALDWFKAATASGRGIASGSSREGREMTFAFQRSSYTGWLTVYGAPREVFIDHLRKSFTLTGGFGLALLGASVLLALAIARRILKPVRALNAAAAPFVRPDKARNAVYAVTELDELHRALDGLTVALTESEARFRAVFAAAPVMLFVLDRDSRLIEVNSIWLRTLGYSRDEVIGRIPWEFHTPESRDMAMTVFRPKFLRTGALDDIPATYVTRSGDLRSVLVSLRGERDKEGAIVRTIGAMRDVTDQRRIEAALTRAVEEAERANRSKTRFLAAASHDLRQPLQALTLYMSVLAPRVGAGERPVMDALEECVGNLTFLLNDMLDVSRLEAGAIVPKLDDVPVARLLERVAADWRIQAEAKGVRLVVARCGAVVRTDPALMGRLLSNLVANAVRYTNRGRILVGCRRVGGAIRLEVWDTGIGIPAEKLEEIFEEFRQLGNPEGNQAKGTGLGLSIVQRIASLLGHPISVRSTSGKGSVFAVTVPAVLTATAAAASLGSQ